MRRRSVPSLKCGTMVALICVMYSVMAAFSSTGIYSTNPCTTPAAAPSPMDVYREQMEAYWSKSELYRDLHAPPTMPTEDDELPESSSRRLRTSP
ncbi:hypothetical protein SPRG_06874 [Saprolegnia parasitica CBS 223.65]|uniref:Uncharacterized protein n=1 Tax=Saprolegnia parasitica (strain CBS 223.65) TaxID=695850 RepID=A0A067CM39_SAPPC|nr:hypothetical protein SPRG_06874 [Saprolegnia parasitica CBS 223.65]KDO27606.1 hypothetical protein SPRG_06874 [Saprolegnia parasitica CBS 223.65]|eukprot:XP_012201728.1 hypothetical protein SPRG_06874 [Saprolegnia parasitica CBS 223.65]